MRILFIAPSSYPVNGAEAIVNIKLLKALSDDGGFEIDLISRKNRYAPYPSDSIESYNINLKNLYVIENQGGFSMKVLVESLCAFAVFKSIFAGCHWAFRALPIVKKLAKENNYDFVLTKNYPSFLLGAYLKGKYGLRWVASWNDPYPRNFYPMPYGKGKDHKQSLIEALQLKQMRKADFHVFPTNALKNHMKSYLNVEENVCFVAPHIVIETKCNTENNEAEQNKNVPLKIIHSGSLVSPRNPRPVINALSRIVKNNPSINIHFTFLGKMEQGDSVYIKSMEHLQGLISIIPAVEYKKSLDILASQDVACVIEADCGVGGGVFLPTKVTDFMQIHKPIFAISPRKGVLEDLYEESSIGYFADIHDETSIYEGLLMIYRDFERGKLKKSSVPQSYRPDSVVDIYKKISLL